MGQAPVENQEKIRVETLANGLTVIVEAIPGVQSAAYDLHIPGGIVSDRAGEEGSSLILAELTSRGAGKLDARALSEAFEDLGILHSESAGQDRFVYHGVMLSDVLPEALELMTMMVQQPTFPAEALDSIKSLFLQDIAALKDNPSRWAFTELSSRYFPAPYNRCSLGTEAGIKALTVDSLRSDWQRRYGPRGAILSISGNVEPDSVLALVRRLFSGWKGGSVARPAFEQFPAPTKHHVSVESAQLQIALASRAAPFGSPHFYASKVIAGLLSGGMFGRLFIEVREKRGLCYSVMARHQATGDYGLMMAYAGTTPERAHETLEVMVGEFDRLAGTVEAEELARAKANLKATLVMSEESTSSRAASNASDWWLDGRVRTLEEIHNGIDAVDSAAVDAALKAFPMHPYSLVTLGSRAISA